MTAAAPARVLNIGADADRLCLTTSILTNAGFDVVQATDGAAALAAASEHPPDLILLDLELRERDGYEVTQRFRTAPATRTVPVVHTAPGYSSSEKKALGYDAGADAYLEQPFAAVELVALVHSLLRLRRDAYAQAEALLEVDRSKNEFLAMLAHELRNPLGAVRVGLSLLDEELASEPRCGKILASLDRQTTHLVRLVEDLLDVSRITHGKVHLRRRTVDLRDVIASAIDAARPGFEQNDIRLEHVPWTSPLLLDGDATRLEQVVTNLLDNAVKFTPKSGTVTVSLSEEGGTAILRVRDSGRGIAAEHLAELFQLFFQGDTSGAKSQAGLGLGLTIVRSLVELHGGKISVTSEGLGRGTEFSVELPLADGVSSEGEISTAPLRAPTESRRVLLVDDHVDLCSLVEMALGDEGHVVDTAFDGIEGFERLVSGNYDVAVIDIGLPRLDGFELAKRARAVLGTRTPHLVAMTGYARKTDRDAANAAGFDTHLVKPVHVSVIIDAVRDAASVATRPSPIP